jgi:hypothetical protein
LSLVRSATALAVSLAWCVVILALAPLAMVQSVGDLLSRWQYVAYTLACVAVVFAFAWFATQRRQVLAMAVAILIGAKLSADVPIGWDRIALLAAMILMLVIAVEVVRQNVSMLRELHQQHSPILAKIGKGVFLWSPVLGLAYLGYLGQGYLDRLAIDMVFEHTPLERYCTVGKAQLACEQEDAGGAHSLGLTIQRLGRNKNIEHHARELFRARQTDLLTRLHATYATAPIPDAIFGDSARLGQALEQLGRQVAAIDILGIPDDAMQTEQQLFDSNIELQALLGRLRDVRAQPRSSFLPAGFRMTRMGELIDRMPIEVTTDATIKQLEAEIAEKRARVLVAGASRLVRQADLGKSLAQQMYRTWSPTSLAIDRAHLEATTPQQMAGARALLAARLVDILDAQERRATQRLIELAQLLQQGLDSGGFKGVPTVDSQLAALGVVAYCTAMPDRAGDGNATPFPCSDSPAIGRLAAAPMSFDENVDRSIQRWRENARLQLEDATRLALVQSLAQSTAGNAKAQSLANVVPTAVNLGRDPCKTLDPRTWGGCLFNEIKDYGERGYESRRAQAGRDYKAMVNKTGASAEISAAELILFERHAGLLQINDAEEGLRHVAKFSQQLAKVVSIVLLVFLCITLVKSFLYIVALVAFDFHGPSLVQVDGTSRIEGAGPRIAAPATEIEIRDLGDTELITKAILDNQAVHLKVAPWPASGILARLLRGKYVAYNRGGVIEATEPIHFSFEKKYVVDWVLQDGEEIIFSYKHFFGASANLRLRSRVSFRLSTMLLGRLVFHSARAQNGPGHLLLVVDSVGLSGAAGARHRTAVPERLVAWHPHTRFQVHNQLTLRSIMMDPFVLVPVSGPYQGHILLKAPGRSVRLFSGAIRHALRVLSPV